MSERLHPDGAPGEQEMAMRAMYGDERYEAMKDTERTTLLAQRGKALSEIDMAKAQVIYVKAKATFWQFLAFALFVATLIGVAFGVVGLAR